MVGSAAGVKKRSFRKSFLLTLILAVFLVLAFARGLAAGAEYSFEVPEERVYVKVNQDSSLDFWYEIEFKNDEDAKPIDIIDMGMPTHNYSIDECAASINGVQLTDIRPSEYVSPGVEVHLGDQAIQPGESAKFNFWGRVPEMVFQDTQNEGYASAEFINTWWDNRYAHGTTNLTFSIEFPPGVRPSETVYHGDKYSRYSDAGGAYVFTWEHPEAKPSEGISHGISFPGIYVAGVYPQQPLPSYEPVGASDYYYDDNGSSGGVLWSVIIPIVLATIGALGRFARSGLRIHGKGAKVKYIAPAMSVEGAGPKTDLDAVEASVLMCQDLDRVASIVFMVLMQKGIVSLKSIKPLKLYKTAKAPKDLPPHYYDFLASVSPDGSIDKPALKMALTTLLKRVEKKTKGYCHEDTVSYYEEVAKNSWIEVKSNVDRNRKLYEFNNKLGFLLLDPAFGSKVRDAFGKGSYYAPFWISSIVGMEAGSPAPEAGLAGETSSVDGSEMADSVATIFNSIQDSTYTVVDDMKESIVKEVNPTEYRRVYGSPYYHRRGYGMRGGGSGCACACACAGCACACAGGGR